MYKQSLRVATVEKFKTHWYLHVSFILIYTDFNISLASKTIKNDANTKKQQNTSIVFICDKYYA